MKIMIGFERRERAQGFFNSFAWRDESEVGDLYYGRGVVCNSLARQPLM